MEELLNSHLFENTNYGKMSSLDGVATGIGMTATEGSTYGSGLPRGTAVIKPATSVRPRVISPLTDIIAPTQNTISTLTNIPRPTNTTVKPVVPIISATPVATPVNPVVPAYGSGSSGGASGGGLSASEEEAKKTDQSSASNTSDSISVYKKIGIGAGILLLIVGGYVAYNHFKK